MTQPSKPLDDPILDEILIQLYTEGLKNGSKHEAKFNNKDWQKTKTKLLKWRSDYVMGLLDDPNLLKLRESTGQKIWVDRDELKRKLKGKGEI